MPRRTGVTAGRLRKVGAEIGIDASDVLAGVAELLTRVNGPRLKTEVMMPAAMIGVREIRDLAPVGNDPDSGSIPKAVFADYGDPKKPNVIIGVNKKISPHAHLVENGHGGPHPSPPHSFFRTGITASRPAMAADMLQRAKKFIVEDK